MSRALRDYDERPSLFQAFAARVRRLFATDGASRTAVTTEQRPDAAPMRRGSI